MSWILIVILAYFCFALASLFDRYLLSGPLPSPGVYAFYVGGLGVWALVLIPFGFVVPDLNQILLSLFAGAIWILAIFLLFSAIFKSEVSRVVPAVGGFLPIFTLLITFIFSSQKTDIGFSYISALTLLVLGSVLITFENDKAISFQNLKNAAMAAFVFGWGFFLMKQVYEAQPFISGFVWMRLGGALASLVFLVSEKTRKQIFVQKPIAKKKVFLPLILGQVCGGLGFGLQSYSVALADMAQIPLINALEGTRYVFLILFVFILSKKYPHLLQEKISEKTLFQKILAIVLIVAGLILLTFQQ